jgi:type II secretory ATPase GspE/PulE/Tfp pilus assembly ATPase PilB-like protein
VLSEIITVSRSLAEKISEGAKIEALRKALKEAGVTTFYDDAREKAAGGITTAEEVRRELGRSYE